VPTSPGPHGNLAIIKAAPTCVLASFEGVLIANWRTEVIAEDVTAAISERNRMLTAGTFRGFIHVAEPGLPVPDEALRQTARRAIEARQSNKSPIALVIVGEGFGASAIRSVGTAVFALRGAPTRLFASTDEAASWLVEKIDTRDQLHALQEACRNVRAWVV
jgi:hypothetical protein